MMWVAIIFLGYFAMVSTLVIANAISTISMRGTNKLSKSRRRR